jgi:hypothetical protein
MEVRDSLSGIRKRDDLAAKFTKHQPHKLKRSDVVVDQKDSLIANRRQSVFQTV